MKGFFDTSTLFKKYLEEKGSQELDELLEKTSQIIVSPITWMEINSIIARRLKEKTLSKKQAEWIYVELKRDFNYFSRVIWNDNLEDKSVEIIRQHQLKTLDGIQLASGLLSRADFFVTSDKKLHSIAVKELKHAMFI